MTEVESLKGIYKSIKELSDDLYDLSEDMKHKSFCGELLSIFHIGEEDTDNEEEIGYYLERGHSHDGVWVTIMKFNSMRDLCEFIHYINGGESKDILDKVTFIENDGGN